MILAQAAAGCSYNRPVVADATDCARGCAGPAYPHSRRAGGSRRTRPSYTRAMFTPLTVVLAVAALALAAWCGWAAYRDQSTKDWHFIGMAVVTLLALVQLVIGIVQLARGEDAAEGTAIFVAYLAAVAACVPVVGLISLTERTKWGSLTVAAGAVVLAVLQARLHDIWGGGSGA
jgi:cation transport ATPase